MSNSSLVNYTKISPNKTSPRNHKIDRITIHHMAGNLSVETCGNVFAPSSRQASSNYGIDSQGRVGMYVEEKDRSWCSSSGANDHRAVTIEVADDKIGSPWHSSDAAMKKLVELCADICRRNGIPKLIYTGDTNGNLTMHKWFANTDCPGNFLESKFLWIAEQVNHILSGGSIQPPTTPSENETLDGYSVGDYVTVSTYYRSSNAPNSEAIFPKEWVCKPITKILKGTKNPYLLGDGFAWCNKGDIRGKGDLTSQKPTSKPSNSIIAQGQVHAKNFAVPELKSDGIVGTETKKAKIKVLQQAMNLDYKSGLTVDGIWGSKSEAVLGKHTVRKGEKQYMVTALEILLMLNGYDPKGVENPGIFGNGLENTVRQFQRDKGLTVDGIAGYNTFKKLIQ